MSSLIYILEYYVLLFFYFYVSFTMICCQAKWLLPISMLNVMPRFAILCFHVFEKMTIKRNFFLNDHVEEQIGRTNVEEYYYVSKLHS